jgi:ABC-type multidrug transport system permease subunit
LQELPTSEGIRFVRTEVIPHTPTALAKAWKQSDLYKQLLAEMRYPSLQDAQTLEPSNTKQWYPEQQEYYPENFFYYFVLNWKRQAAIFRRDNTFAIARVFQVFLVGAIAGSLFSNIEPRNVSTMNGFLFNTVLFTALGSFALLPLVFAQKAVFYKQKDSLFYPTFSFTLAQTITLIPLAIIESVFYITIVYWSAGLANDENGSRFLTFILISFTFSLAMAQIFRFLSAVLPSPGMATPVAGIMIIVMILFSGFILPKAIIPPGWEWFYYINPISWALKAVTVNEFMSTKYDFDTCINPACTSTKRFGTYILEQYGNPTDEAWIWYSFAVLFGEFVFFGLLTSFCYHYIRTQPNYPVPIRESPEGKNEENWGCYLSPRKVKHVSNTNPPVTVGTSGITRENDVEMMELGGNSQNKTIKYGAREEKHIEQLPFDQVSIAFRDIWYTVSLKSGEDVDLLKGVNGYFEPGTLTCLMGSSGAGKTTLLDVLAGRKNTGVIKGEIYLNGIPKVENYFRKIMGYVEQFDTLPQKTTAKEAIAFSAALRLAPGITR